jgi:hypothetical protein
MRPGSPTASALISWLGNRCGSPDEATKILEQRQEGLGGCEPRETLNVNPTILGQNVGMMHVVGGGLI